MKRGGNRTERNSKYRPGWPAWAEDMLIKLVRQHKTAYEIADALSEGGAPRVFNYDSVKKKAHRLGVHTAVVKYVRTNNYVKRGEFIVPDSVIDERDSARAAPQTLTAIIMGDPLPGRSALDRR